MHLQFQGAARTVTGSMHILSVGGKTLLLDCGIFHGRRDEAWNRNSKFPFDPPSIDAVVLSHAHIDHSGNLPGLVRQGFRGPIYSTSATQSLCTVMLRDSAYIQERDAEFISKRHREKGLPPVEPLYNEQDVDETVPLFQGREYGKNFEIQEGVECRFEDAGHILGSAAVAFTLREGSRVVRLAFTGDLGRPNLPILRDPVFIGPPEGTDYLICESTYGGRFHSPVEEMEDQLLEPILRTYDRRGKIIIPAFSVGRTQEIVYLLHKMSSAGKIDHMPVFVDSPLSVNVTDVFRKHPECFDQEALAMINASVSSDPFGFERLKYVRTLEESKQLNDQPGPCIIIAASGMCEAGRIVHHLANGVGNPNNMVMIVGYQAENTLGKKLVMREPVVNILGEPHEVRSEVVVLNAFSAHADQNEILGYVQGFNAHRPKSIFLVHGDPDQEEKLAERLEGAGFGSVRMPVRGELAELN